MANLRMRKNLEKSLSDFMGEVILRQLSLHHVRTAETYASTLRSFMRFRQGRDCLLTDLTPDLVQRYEAWLYDSGVVPNTASFYLKRLRAAYNKAVAQGLVDQQYPFREVYTSKAKTVKRAISRGLLRKIATIDLSAKPFMAFARDLFLFSYYTRGMSFIDMAYLRKSNLRDGILTYRRHKTGQILSIRWEPCMQQLVDRLGGGGDYLLPIIRSVETARHDYQRAQQRVNYGLHRLSEEYGMVPAITMYVARHSWATRAQDLGTPLAVISSSLGHESISTTQIYLATIDTATIDKANQKILKDLGV